MFRFLFLLLLCISVVRCEQAPETATVLTAAFPVEVPPPPPPPPPVYDYDTTQWAEMIRLDSSIRLDLRYATDNNFMKQVIYDCGRCFYRPQVARALLKVHQGLKAQNLGLKMYDCYRPGPYQQRLWDVLPDARYVANPRKGSLHSRGAAADLTIVHLDTGEELDMGTTYDFFGEEAYTTTTNLPQEVLDNRALFQAAMRAQGFLTIRTEWWHFNFSGPRLPLSDWVWECDE
ncbi:M15 family metallopeptidase [Neolewinella agarilytica]|uniref:D-alanyl-D-alanine dipeptidase n=1 Tax=Neolewinella agarilytica TaxID=478744 RepID=A0A1H9N5F6_9BACT|nr:M15 family metallopeptidase [Neolewinella agarilytica]SER31216.1 D-alanyl-D-alanine dipeptidase [Neolewinella agarilytica]